MFYAAADCDYDPDRRQSGSGHASAEGPSIDSERGLLALVPNLERSRTLIVDDAAGKVVQAVRNQDQATSICAGDEFHICDTNAFVAPRVYFAENGRTLCETAGVSTFENHPVCRDVGTVKTIAEFRGVEGGEPASASTRGSRMVLSKLDYLPAGNGGRARSHSGARTETCSGRVVWDFRSGTEVAAWRRYGEAFGSLATAVAISPSGNYVAEVLGDELQIYQIP